MAEDLPQDQNQGQQSQEEQQEWQHHESEATRIEVTSHEGDKHLGEVALAVGGHETGSEDAKQSDNENDGSGHILPGTPTEEPVPATYIRNEEKAEVMAHAQNDAADNGEQFPQNAALRAGIGYDMDIAQKKAKGYEPSKAEKVGSVEQLERYNINQRNLVLRYSSAITEHYKEHGDTPSPALMALAAAHELVQDTGHQNFEIETNGDFFAADNVSVTFDEYENVVVQSGDDQKNVAEKFTLSMFHGASYEVTESQAGADEDFDEVVTTKRRILKPEDVQRLEEILAPAIEFRDEQKRLNDEEQQVPEDEGSHDDSFGHQANWS